MSAKAAIRHVHEAVEALRLGDRRRALALIEAAMVQDPNNPILVANRDRLRAGSKHER